MSDYPRRDEGRDRVQKSPFTKDLFPSARPPAGRTESDLVLRLSRQAHEDYDRQNQPEHERAQRVQRTRQDGNTRYGTDDLRYGGQPRTRMSVGDSPARRTPGTSPYSDTQRTTRQHTTSASRESSRYPSSREPSPFPDFENPPPSRAPPQQQRAPSRQIRSNHTTVPLMSTQGLARRPIDEGIDRLQGEFHRESNAQYNTTFDRNVANWSRDYHTPPFRQIPNGFGRGIGEQRKP